MEHSRFCLVLPGDTASSRRLTEVILAGASLTVLYITGEGTVRGDNREQWFAKYREPRANTSFYFMVLGFIYIKLRTGCATAMRGMMP